MILDVSFVFGWSECSFNFFSMTGLVFFEVNAILVVIGPSMPEFSTNLERSCARGSTSTLGLGVKAGCICCMTSGSTHGNLSSGAIPEGEELLSSIFGGRDHFCLKSLLKFALLSKRT